MVDFETLDVLDPGLYGSGRAEDNGLPLDLYDYLRVNKPCFRQELTEPSFIDSSWVVTRHSDALMVARDDERFTSTKGSSVRLFDPGVEEHGGKASILTMDGVKHHRLRRIVSRGFTPAAIAALEDRLRRATVDILDEALQADTFEFVEEVARKLPMRAICDLVGVPDEDRAQIVKWGDAITAPSDEEMSGGPEGMLAASMGIWEYALRWSAERQRMPADDLVSKLVAAHGLEKLDDDELMSMVLLLVAAGNETTRHNISHGMHALILNPEQWALLKEDTAATITSGVEEILRYSSAVVGFSRRALVELEIHGKTIRPDEVVSFILASANFDPDVFVQPRTFDLTRSPNKHVAFGSGPHVCLGASLARMETRIMFEELARRIDTIELAGPVVYARDAILRGCRQLPVTVTVQM